ncbi:hypothetical protein IOK49_00345 [Fervidicoccus fontis]|uniref:Uncharacterized protein n=1 Tax=Fervidicoccus fontis TaxID=683846 RepID=A0A843AFZ9_9CREN|nr:hypothetical protein [Fervidicoccus fontis]MBE9390539.1 hypothetical protein [Fervidicoccus fontis]
MSEDDRSRKIFYILGISGLLAVIFLIGAIVYAEIDTPSLKPMYSQPGLKLDYLMNVSFGNFSVQYVRIETVVSRYPPYNYTVNVIVANTTQFPPPPRTIEYNNNVTFPMGNGYAMEGLQLNSLVPIGTVDYELNGVKILGERFLDPQTGSIITVDLDKGIILEVRYSYYGVLNDIKLIDMSGGSLSYAWSR